MYIKNSINGSPRSLMTTPRCQICHQQYSAQRVPFILQPCSHGMCKPCADEYIVVRGSTSCPTCRQTILRHSVNYDLKQMCTETLDDWKKEFINTLGNKKGVRISIDDIILPAVPLIMCRLDSNRSSLHDAIVSLVRNADPDDVYRWVDVLQFPQDWDVETLCTKMLRHHEFLDKQSAGWLLEFL